MTIQWKPDTQKGVYTGQFTCRNSLSVIPFHLNATTHKCHNSKQGIADCTQLLLYSFIRASTAAQHWAFQ